MSNSSLIVAATFLAAFLGLDALGIAGAGPVAVVAGLGALGWTQRGQPARWSSLGLVAPGSARRLALATLGCLLAGWGTALVATLLAVRGFGWSPIATDRFAGLAGNTPMLLGMLAISWTTAAFGEEALFRGFLQDRLRDRLGSVPGAGVLAAALQAVPFGLGHAYQGRTGILTTAVLGFAFGLCRLRLRSLWPLVIAHGLIDTVSMLALYRGVVPGG